MYSWLNRTICQNTKILYNKIFMPRMKKTQHNDLKISILYYKYQKTHFILPSI